VVLLVFFKLVLWFCCLQGQCFHTNNPYKDYTNAFEQGLQKCKDGDLNSSVLLLEAAILQDPLDSEVKNPKLGNPFIEHLCVCGFLAVLHIICFPKPSKRPTETIF